MFKSKQEIIVIQAEALKPIDTNVVFWSHDHGTAKLIFKLQKDGISQSLAEGTIVPVLLEFNSSVSENGRGRHIYHAEIVDALNGIVSIVLEDNILGYIGRVDGSIYIELPDSRSLDTAGRFTFDIKRSPIDENVPELEDYYWQGFNKIMNQYHETIATIKLEAKELLDSLSDGVAEVKNDIATANTRIEEINKKIDDNDVFTKAESSANVIAKIDERNFVDAWKMADGTFTNVYPNENLFVTGKKMGEKFRMTKTNTYYIEVPTGIKIDPGKIYTFTWEYEHISGNDAESIAIGYGLEAGTTVREGSNRPISSKLVSFKAMETLPDNGDYLCIRINLSQTQASSVYDYCNLKIEIVDSVGQSTVYTANPIDDYPNSFPKFKGQRLANSNNPDDYDWQYTDQYVDYAIAANHVQNLATQTEAEAGTDNSKSMTPLGTAQQIEKKAVTVASNQTIGGIKNFKDGLLLDGKTVITRQNADATYAVNSTGASLWTGISTLNENHTVTPTKKMSECQNGWLLVFAPYNGSTAQNYDVTTVFVPKGHTRLSIVQIFNGSNWTQKRYQCSDSTITGHSSNVGTEQIKASLIEVREV